MSHGVNFASRTRNTYAQLNRRVLAAVFDGIILWFSTAAVANAIDNQLVTRHLLLPADAAPLGWILRVLMALCYFAILESAGSCGSIGKLMCDLRVDDLNGERLSLGRSVARNLAKPFSLLFAGIGFLMPLWTPRRQTLHDMMTACVVRRRC